MDENTLMAESEEELNSVLIRVKEESERFSLNLNVKEKKKEKRLRSWYWFLYFMANRRGKCGSSDRFPLGL